MFRWSKRIEAQSTRKRPATKIKEEALRKDIAMYSDAYQYERAERLGVSQRGICWALKRLGINRKKTLSPPRADVSKRSAFEDKINAYQQAKRVIVFIAVY